MRVPTWLPCRLQICLNGHHWLAGRLHEAGIEYRMADNAFTHIGDWKKAQAISDGWEAKRIHERSNELARLCCPIYRDFATGYHWSVNQCEQATDVVFRKQADLQAIYGKLTRTAIHTVKPDNIAPFPGKQLCLQFEGDSGNRFNICLEGTRIKHTMGRFHSNCATSSPSFSGSRPRSTFAVSSTSAVCRTEQSAAPPCAGTQQR